MVELKTSETQDTIIQALYTPPGLPNATLDVLGPRVRREDPFLATPERSLDEEDASTSFIIPSTSFEVKQFTNLQDVVPEWEDEEVDEIMVLSPKTKSGSAVRVIPAGTSRELSDLSAKAINISSYQSLQVLSSSSVSSKVCLCKSRQSGQLYAVKTFLKSQLFYDAPKLEQVMTEQMMLKLLTQMDLPFVLRLRQSFQDKDALYIVTDFCSGGDIRTLIDRSAPLHPTHARFYAAELADALHFLHTSGIMHRAVIPEHILIGGDGHIVLTGFSRASVSGPHSPRAGLPISTSRDSQAHQNQSLTELTEVNAYTAPEVILGWDCDPSVDSWGFGMVLYFMLTGKHPFVSAHETRVNRSLLEAMILHAPLQIMGYEGLVSNEAYNVLCSTLNRNPRLRMTTEGIKSHAYFTNTDWSRLHAKRYEGMIAVVHSWSCTQSHDDIRRHALYHSAPLAIPDYKFEEGLTEGGEFGTSDSLSGVHIPGFDFACSDIVGGVEVAEAGVGQATTLEHTVSPSSDRSSTHASVGPLAVGGPQDDEASASDAQLSASADTAAATSKDQSDIKAGTGSNEDGTRGGSMASNANSAQSGNSAPSASTALYSCTSFGELREALNIKENSGLAVAALRTDSDGITRSGAATGSDFGSGALKRLQQVDSQARPIGIMRKTGDVPRAGLGRGLGLRKYASLDFDLDTIVSLDADLSSISAKLNSSADTDASGASSFQKHTPPAVARRRVSFVDGPSGSPKVNSNSTSNSTYTSTPRSTRNDTQWSPSWMSLNFSKYASPNINPNKLRKKRTASTPALLNTPHLLEKVDLPAGLEQIGLGIGYTHTHARSPVPAPVLAQGKEERAPLETPRRSVSLGASVARYGALFANLKRGRGGSNQNASAKIPDVSTGTVERASEESDAMDAVMREMYGSAWDAELGVGLYGGRSAAVIGPSSSRRRVPGRVYSVYAEQADLDSTLRLVEPICPEDA